MNEINGFKVEIWKDVIGYEGLYKVSDFGNVKSLSRITKNNGGFYLSKEKILKQYIDSLGYPRVGLAKNNVGKKFRIHVLVAMAFMGHVQEKYKTVVDHIDNDKTNNKLINLQLITQRKNASKNRSGTSKFTGVCFKKANKKWLSSIQINGKTKHLGYYDNEIDAHNAYQEKLKQITICQ